jgi:hypothetical protein
MGQGLALFAGKKYEEEQARIDKEWEMSIEKMRVQRENAREDRAVARDDKRTATETERYLAGQETQRETARLTAEDRAARLKQGNEHFDKKQAADATEAHFARLAKYQEDYTDELDANAGMDPDGRIRATLGEKTDNAVAAFVTRMAAGNAPGFEIDSEEAMGSKLIQMGMDPGGADIHKKVIWASVTGQGPPPPSPGSDVAPGEREARIAAYEAERSNLGSTGTGITDWLFDSDSPPPVTAPQPGTPPQNTAAASQVDMVSPSGAVPAQGGASNLFNSEPLKNPDGSLKFPMDKESLGYRGFDWLKNKRVPYGQ